MTAKALLTSAWQHWTTPDAVLQRVRCIEPIDLDPCGNAQDKVGAQDSWWGEGATEAENKRLFQIDADAVGRGEAVHYADGLRMRWLTHGRGLIYVNPPYGRAMVTWLEKVHAEADAGAEIVLLVPARTDAGWWHEHVAGVATARCFWRGRLRFGNPEPGKRAGESSTFPSAVAYYGRRPYAFGAAFEDAGEIVIG